MLYWCGRRRPRRRIHKSRHADWDPPAGGGAACRLTPNGDGGSLPEEVERAAAPGGGAVQQPGNEETGGGARVCVYRRTEARSHGGVWSGPLSCCCCCRRLSASPRPQVDGRCGLWAYGGGGRAGSRLTPSVSK